ncbi:hypothetical protein JL720_9434 [Aureococcus anophagefferens]|nr:hypothetical protein JL720_9434 [Aureococcus anophagefferens]
MLIALRRRAAGALCARQLSAAAAELTRNIGISAHIDSGKTTLTERILYYTGRIGAIHDVRGKDGVGAKMDSMDLEREKGITIQSAATHCTWGANHVNIIDTPGHADFTIEVGASVLDGGVLVLCGVSGVQSQSLTVDRQMKRYDVPRVAFVNKLDRAGADPDRVVAQVREQMALNACAVQLPVGLEAAHEGVIDLVRMKRLTFAGDRGEDVVEDDVPAASADLAEERRAALVEAVADVDDDVAEAYLEGLEVDGDALAAGIRRATMARDFVPVFMGSAFKNKGVQPLLDGVVAYLPSPPEREGVVALDLEDDETPLTYVRIYQGTLRKGATIVNARTRAKTKVPRLVRMHSDDMEDIDAASAGDVVAMFGVDCASMDSFAGEPKKGAKEAPRKLAMASMYVPRPVISIAVAPKKGAAPNVIDAFGNALQRFAREDPTLRVHVDAESKQTILSGMGELHLDVYVERMKREYKVDVDAGMPSVNYREAISKRADFEYLHKKQTGGSGQYAKVVGYVEPLEDDFDGDEPFEFVNECVGTNVPSEYIPSVEKGARDAIAKGNLIGFPVEGMRVVLQDGAAHAVDSSDMAFRAAGQAAVRGAIDRAKASVLEPLMALEVTVPAEFQGDIMGAINQRRGIITHSEISADGSHAVINAEVPLANLFGYSTDVRSATQGKGEFTMEYVRHANVLPDIQAELVKEHQEKRAAGTA